MKLNFLINNLTTVFIILLFNICFEVGALSLEEAAKKLEDVRNTYSADPSPDNLRLLHEAEKEFNTALKDSVNQNNTLPVNDQPPNMQLNGNESTTPLPSPTTLEVTSLVVETSNTEQLSTPTVVSEQVAEQQTRETLISNDQPPEETPAPPIDPQPSETPKPSGQGMATETPVIGKLPTKEPEDVAPSAVTTVQETPKSSTTVAETTIQPISKSTPQPSRQVENVVIDEPSIAPTENVAEIIAPASDKNNVTQPSQPVENTSSNISSIIRSEPKKIVGSSNVTNLTSSSLPTNTADRSLGQAKVPSTSFPAPSTLVTDPSSQPSAAIISSPPSDPVISSPPSNPIISSPPSDPIIPPSDPVISSPPSDPVISSPPSDSVFSSPPPTLVKDDIVIEKIENVVNVNPSNLNDIFAAVGPSSTNTIPNETNSSENAPPKRLMIVKDGGQLRNRKYEATQSVIAPVDYIPYNPEIPDAIAIDSSNTVPITPKSTLEIPVTSIGSTVIVSVGMKSESVKQKQISLDQVFSILSKTMKEGYPNAEFTNVAITSLSMEKGDSEATNLKVNFLVQNQRLSDSMIVQHLNRKFHISTADSVIRDSDLFILMGESGSSSLEVKALTLPPPSDDEVNATQKFAKIWAISLVVFSYFLVLVSYCYGVLGIKSNSGKNRSSIGSGPIFI